MNPNDFQKRLLKNPWFLWILLILGVNPLYLVGPSLNLAATQLNEVTQEAGLSALRSR